MTARFVPPPLPIIGQKKSPISLEPIEALGQKAKVILPPVPVLLQDIESISVPICAGKFAERFLPDLFNLKLLFVSSAVAHVTDPKNAHSKDRAWAFVGFPTMPHERVRKGHRPTEMLLLVNDLDHGNMSADEVQASVMDFFGADTVATIYSTSSSKPEAKRWRVVVPLAAPIPVAEWRRLQHGFAEAMLAAGVQVDASMTKPTQISFGPNVPVDARDADGVPLHFEHLFWGDTMFNPAMLTLTAVAMLELVDELEAVEARRQQERAAERERKATEREAQRQQALAAGGDGLSTVERFNLAHTVESLLEKYGYHKDPHKPDQWRSPMQTSGTFATVVRADGTWASQSGSDAQAGLGRRAASGAQHGDGFDLFVHFEHAGNYKAAIKAASQMFGVQHPGTQPSLDAFTAMPAPVPAVMPPSVFAGLTGFAGFGSVADRNAGGRALSSNGDGKGWTASRSNLEVALLDDGFCHRVGRDDFLCQTMICDPGESKWRPLKDTDVFNVGTCLERKGFKAIPRETLRDAINAVAEKNAFDSAKDWLNGLEWDGVPRVAQFLANGWGTADAAYQQAIGLYTWTALAGRVLMPGTKADMVAVAVGMQGSRKSSAVAAMAPAPEFFGELDLSLEEADLFRAMKGRMVLELGELAGMRKKEAEHLKRFVAATHNVWVEKWQTSVTNYPRRSIFFGTTNEPGFLSDPTGSRRWLPFEAGNCDPDWIAANRDQLYAEGAHLFRANGVMFAQAEKLARDVSVDFATVDSWDDVIGPWAAVHNQHGSKPILIVDALRNGIGLTTAQINRAAEMRAGASLQRLGYIRVQRRLGEGRRGWVYVKQI